MNREYQVEGAKPDDIAAIAALFTESFKESVLHHCGRLPKPQAMQDVFALVYQAEPEAAFVARSAAGQAIGYCFAPAKLPRLWLKAILGGHLFKWAWRWVTGQYGFGLHPVKIIVLNKLAFLRSAATPSQSASARILSIAVSPDWRGKGAAGALMAVAMDYFAARGVGRVRLEVRPDNEPAVRLYHHCGFADAGFTYDSQGPWLIMFKEMEQSHV
ncbi:MAG: GNAT family N-acetyltransferase [Negativicutes bacterium]|nr:GNAT family N-acetyltransferase [Negativicutes bacterium]